MYLGITIKPDMFHSIDLFKGIQASRLTSTETIQIKNSSDILLLLHYDINEIEVQNYIQFIFILFDKCIITELH